MNLYCCQVQYDILEHVMLNYSFSHSFSSPLVWVPITGCNSVPLRAFYPSPILPPQRIHNHPIEGSKSFKDIPRILHGLPLFPAIFNQIPNPSNTSIISMLPEIVYSTHICVAVFILMVSFYCIFMIMLLFATCFFSPNSKKSHFFIIRFLLNSKGSFLFQLYWWHL